jgi:tetratricopeptide (TPR) repeat protein
MQQLYPQDGGETNPYVLLAKIHREKGDLAAERQALEKLASLTSSAPDVFDRLCELAIKADDWPAAKKAVLQALAVNPLSPAVQRHAAVVSAKLNDKDLAVASYRALLLLGTIDAADTHYQLATFLHQQGDLAEAKRHTLLALEEAPRFRAAQKLLLQIVAVNPAANSPVVKQSDKSAPKPTPDKADTENSNNPAEPKSESPDPKKKPS